MVYQLLKKAIEQSNSFMTKDMIALQIVFYLTVGKITQAEADELNLMIAPQEVITVE
jgi:hypothetical protein